MDENDAIEFIPELLALWEAVKWERSRGWEFTPRTTQAMEILDLREAEVQEDANGAETKEARGDTRPIS